MRQLASLLFLLHLLFSFASSGQELYSAKGYWVEATKANYLTIKQRLNRGDSISTNETAYLKDYESYLSTYFERMSEDDRREYFRMKDQWNRELGVAELSPALNKNTLTNDDFEWRNRDRLVNTLYGAYYGTSFVVLAEINGAAAAGIPLIAGGLWLLGPAINPKKYEGISRNTIRANNTGKLLGLGYGAALGLALGGESNETSKWALGLSSAGSIALGEAAFQLQKKRNTPRGQIEMMRHYGILAPLVGASLLAAGHVDNPNLYGLALLGGGVTGLIMGSKVSKKYDYSQGDVDAVSSLTVIMAGLGFTFVAEALDQSNDPNALILIPAATAILGTMVSQKAVRGIHLTNKQGSTLQLSTAGAALIGFGIAALAEADSPGVIIGVPCVLALITHQILFHNFKMQNLGMNHKASEKRKNAYGFSLNVKPENYLLNKNIPVWIHSSESYFQSQNPLVNIRFTF
jgi:hypothetical protein